MGRGLQVMTKSESPLKEPLLRGCIAVQGRLEGAAIQFDCGLTLTSRWYLQEAEAALVRLRRQLSQRAGFPSVHRLPKAEPTAEKTGKEHGQLVLALLPLAEELPVQIEAENWPSAYELASQLLLAVRSIDGGAANSWLAGGC